MDKKELFEKIESLPSHTSITTFRPYVDKKIVLGLISQLDEPQKVKVPQFVAEWYEENKDDFEFNVWDWIAFRNEPEKLENKEFNSWINNYEGNPVQTLVNMHQFGYTVEEGKRYLVSLKNGQPLTKTKSGKAIYFNQDIITGNYKFTRKELEEAGFCWVFDCEGIEIEEVE